MAKPWMMRATIGTTAIMLSVPDLSPLLATAKVSPLPRTSQTIWATMAPW